MFEDLQPHGVAVIPTESIRRASLCEPGRSVRQRALSIRLIFFAVKIWRMRGFPTCQSSGKGPAFISLMSHFPPDRTMLSSENV